GAGRKTGTALRRGCAVVVELDAAAPALPESCFYAVSLLPGDFESGVDDTALHSVAPDQPCEFRLERPGGHCLQLWLVGYISRRSLGWNELETGRAKVAIGENDADAKLRVTVTAADVKAKLAELGF